MPAPQSCGIVFPLVGRPPACSSLQHGVRARRKPAREGRTSQRGNAHASHKNNDSLILGVQFALEPSDASLCSNAPSGHFGRTFGWGTNNASKHHCRGSGRNARKGAWEREICADRAGMASASVAASKRRSSAVGAAARAPIWASSQVRTLTRRVALQMRSGRAMDSLRTARTNSDGFCGAGEGEEPRGAADGRKSVRGDAEE